MKKIIVCALSLLFLLVVRPNSQVHAGRALPVHVGQDGEVDNEVVNVGKSAGDEVLWSTDGDSFTISFPASPFAASTFHVPAGGNASSGPVVAGAGIGHYQYFISDDNDGQGADPDVNMKK